MVHSGVLITGEKYIESESQLGAVLSVSLPVSPSVKNEVFLIWMFSGHDISQSSYRNIYTCCLKSPSMFI